VGSELNCGFVKKWWNLAFFWIFIIAMTNYSWSLSSLLREIYNWEESRVSQQEDCVKWSMKTCLPSMTVAARAPTTIQTRPSMLTTCNVSPSRFSIYFEQIRKGTRSNKRRLHICKMSEIIRNISVSRKVAEITYHPNFNFEYYYLSFYIIHFITNHMLW